MSVTSRPIILVLITLFALSGAGPSLSTHAAPLSDIQSPVLKWQRGGCYSSWCETGWYSSPAVADLDGNGAMEMIGAACTLFVLNGENGSE
jgi:hypothetical protein